MENLTRLPQAVFPWCGITRGGDAVSLVRIEKLCAFGEEES